MNDMETFNAITPLLNPGITDEEAKEVVAGLTDSQKDIAILALTRVFRETMARIKKSDSQDALSRVLMGLAEKV